MKMLSTVSRVLCCTAVAAMTGFFSQSADAQLGQWAFGQTPNEFGDRVTRVPAGGSITCGTGAITRVDDTGDVSWMLKIGGFDPDAVITTSDGGFAAAGLYMLDNQRFTLLAKLDAAGNVMWTHLYPGQHNSEPCDLIEFSTGGYVIALDHFSTDKVLQLPFLIKTKADGNVEWMYRYKALTSSNPLGFFSYVEEGIDSDGGPVLNVVGGVYDANGQSDTLLARIDFFGGVILSRTIGYQGFTDFGRGLTRSGDSGFFVTGDSKQLGEGGGTYLMRVFDDFTLDWYRGLYGFAGTKEINFSPEGDALLTGSTSFPNPERNAVLLAIDTGTQTLTWAMQYGGPDIDNATDMAIGPNGYIVFGDTRSFDVLPVQDFYYVKTDYFGKSGCNESEIDIGLTPDLPPEQTTKLEPILVHEVPQVEPEWSFTNFMEAVLCDDPEPCVCVEPPFGMTAWWTLDEMVGPVAAESIAGLDGVHIDNPIPLAAMVDFGLLFDGVDDLVEAPSGPTVNVPAAQGGGAGSFGHFSIDAWIRIDDNATLGWGPIMEKRELDGGPGYAFFVNDGTLNLALDDGSATMIFSSVQPLPMNQFVHVAASVRRTSAGSVAFYVDGVLDIAAEPMTVLGSLANGAPVWIGAMRYEFGPGSNRHYFNGVIDEVEFFDRALSSAEINSIYNAQECGKCKFDCDVPWDVPFCQDDVKVMIVVTVCNYSPEDATIELTFAPVNPPDCGTIDGPTGFTVLGPSNPVVVPGNSCVDVDVSIDRPLLMNSLFDLGCFEVTLTNLDNGQTNSCLGSVQDRRDLCPDIDDVTIDLVPNIDSSVLITIRNTDLEEMAFAWRAAVYGPDMESLSQNIGINDRDPGDSTVGQMKIPLGATRDLSFTLKARNFEGLSRSDFVLTTMINGTVAPLCSVSLKTVLEESACIGDLNGDGVVDGADLAIVLGSWGECVGCASDLNGDDIVNGADLAIILGNWGQCSG